MGKYSGSKRRNCLCGQDDQVLSGTQDGFSTRTKAILSSYGSN